MACCVRGFSVWVCEGEGVHVGGECVGVSDGVCACVCFGMVLFVCMRAHACVCVCVCARVCVYA